MKNWHVFRALQHCFLFDVISNSLFMIEEPVYNYLLGYPIATEVLAQVKADLAELQEQGYLQEEPEAEPELKREASLKALCLHIAHDCNLRCRYCFAAEGHFGGQKELMPFAVGQAAIDLLLHNSSDREQLEVDFFGGEPLINFEVVKQLVLYGEKEAPKYHKKINFTLTTNGVALNEEVQQFLNEHQIAVVLSLDGRPQVNDLMRGVGTYDRIVPQMREFLQKRNWQKYYVRGTYTAYNLDFAADVKHLYELGFREISLEPVIGEVGDYQISLRDLPMIGREYDKLAEFYWEKRMSGDPFTFFHFEISLEQGPCLPKRLTGCGAGFDYFAVTPRGEFFPCHQFVGEEKFRMGNVLQGISQTDLQKKFGQATLYKKVSCNECWSRFYCSGGCHANAHKMNNSIYEPDKLSCELQKKRLELALALKALAMNEK